MENKIFNYNGTNITFQLGNGDVMVNATEMAKPFGKSPNHFLRTQTTKDFINELSALRKCNPTDLVKVINGGNNFGTWMHEDVALEFSRWLSPKFAIWCNDRIKELLTKGSVALDISNPNTVLQIVQNWKEEHDKRLKLEKQNAVLLPKAEIHDKVMATDTKIDIGQTAKILDLPFGRNTLFKKLREKGILFKNKNEPKQEYIKRGYFELKEILIPRNNHDDLIKLKVLVTQRGLGFISKLFNSEPPKHELALVG